MKIQNAITVYNTKIQNEKEKKKSQCKYQTKKFTHGNVIFVEFTQRIQEIHVSQQLLRWSPIIGYLFPRSRWIVNPIRFQIFHDTDGRHDKSDTWRWTLH